MRNCNPKVNLNSEGYLSKVKEIVKKQKKSLDTTKRVLHFNVILVFLFCQWILEKLLKDEEETGRMRNVVLLDAE